MRTRAAVAISSPSWVVVAAQAVAFLAVDPCSGSTATLAAPVLVAVVAAGQSVALALGGARTAAVVLSVALGVVAALASLALYGLAAVAPLGCGDWSFQT